MAHFAELDENNIVLRVCVVSNDIQTSDGSLGDNDKHVDGEKWCEDFWGGTWKQTSYNKNFRKNYASIGMVYDEAKDIFMDQKPYASWSLDENNDWVAPVTYPNVVEYDWDESTKAPYYIEWDETNQKWLSKTYPSPNQTETSHTWNASTLKWEND